jgi:hypothetical protein
MGGFHMSNKGKDGTGEICASTRRLFFERGHNRSNSAVVLKVRLAQEKPEYYEAYIRREYKSVTAAAAAAGLIKDDADLRRAKSAFRKMSASQRQELLEWQQNVLRQKREHNV